MNKQPYTTMATYDKIPATPAIPAKLDKMPKMPRNNHTITCKIYKNTGLFTGDTYTYRGIFKRNSGDFSTKFRGYIVPLENIQAIRNEIVPQVQGYLVYREFTDLPIHTSTEQPHLSSSTSTTAIVTTSTISHIPPAIESTNTHQLTKKTVVICEFLDEDDY